MLYNFSADTISASTTIPTTVKSEIIVNHEINPEVSESMVLPVVERNHGKAVSY